MTRHLRFGMGTAAILTALALFGFAYVRAGGDGPDQHLTGGGTKAAQNAYPQPDTSSADWKPLSDDLGIWLAKSDRTGLRGRLYARIGDSWIPIAIDGAADIQGVFPAR